MTENKFPKKELIVLAIGEAIFVLVTILSFLGVSVSGIIEFEFSYRVIHTQNLQVLQKDFL